MTVTCAVYYYYYYFVGLELIFIIFDTLKKYVQFLIEERNMLDL